MISAMLRINIRTMGLKEKKNPAWETREGFLEEVTPEPKLQVNHKYAR